MSIINFRKIKGNQINSRVKEKLSTQLFVLHKHWFNIFISCKNYKNGKNTIPLILILVISSLFRKLCFKNIEIYINMYFYRKSKLNEIFWFYDYEFENGFDFFRFYGYENENGFDIFGFKIFSILHFWMLKMIFTFFRVSVP